jgi:hypothetical protein
VFFFLANYSQISTLEKWQLLVQRKKKGRQMMKVRQKASGDGWDGPESSLMVAPIGLSKP